MARVRSTRAARQRGAAGQRRSRERRFQGRARIHKDDDYYQGETRHGRFYRRLRLPAWAKLEQIKADHKDGVLEVRVPMPARPKVALA